MKVLTKTGDEFPIQDRLVTCCLNFRRRPFLVKTYKRNHNFKFDHFEILKLWIHELNFIRQPFLNEAMVSDITVFRGVSRYQYGQGVGDVLRGKLQFVPMVARFLKPVAIKGAQTLLKSGSEAIKKVPHSKT